MVYGYRAINIDNKTLFLLFFPYNYRYRYNIVVASVKGVKSPLDAKKLLDGLKKVHSHLVNAETIIQTYEDLKIPGFTHENVEALKRELQTFSKKINLDIQALKVK